MKTEKVKTKTLWKITSDTVSALFEVNEGKVTIVDFNGTEAMPSLKDLTPEQLTKAGETLIDIAKAAQRQIEREAKEVGA